MNRSRQPWQSQSRNSSVVDFLFSMCLEDFALVRNFLSLNINTQIL